MTEMYSAFCAEVPLEPKDGPTSMNEGLLGAMLDPPGKEVGQYLNLILSYDLRELI